MLKCPYINEEANSSISPVVQQPLGTKGKAAML